MGLGFYDLGHSGLSSVSPVCPFFIWEMGLIVLDALVRLEPIASKAHSKVLGFS